jgi:hypothetical protein
MDEYCMLVSKKLENKSEQAMKRFRVTNDYLCKISNVRDRIILPNCILKDFFKEVHYAYGHVGPSKVYKIICEHFFAPKLRKSVHETNT